MSTDHHGIAIEYGTSPKTFASCVIGLVLSLIFTLLAFGMVWTKALTGSSAFTALAVLALLQLITQVVFFLRINNSKEGIWNALPFYFTIIIIAVILCGSLWIMANLNYFMMH